CLNGYLDNCVNLFTNQPTPSETYTLSLHDALPISEKQRKSVSIATVLAISFGALLAVTVIIVLGISLLSGIATTRDLLLDKAGRSEEHTSELQSRENLVCRLLLEKKNT